MPFRKITLPLLILVFVGVLTWSFVYGPAKRRFVVPDRSVEVASAGALDRLWHATGVQGRVAVIFSRHLDQQFSRGAFPETGYLDTAMRHGIVRTAYYIVPDRFWSEVVLENRAYRNHVVLPIVTDTGFMMLHEAGRIHVMPLSKYIPQPGEEKVLVVLDPDVWSQEERSRINDFMKSGQVVTDLLAVVGGP